MKEHESLPKTAPVTEEPTESTSSPMNYFLGFFGLSLCCIFSLFVGGAGFIDMSMVFALPSALGALLCLVGGVHAMDQDEPQ